MKIVEEYKNPCRSRYVAKYNALNEEQQKAWDAIDSLPKEKIYLKYIKRKRKPEVGAGTVFAMLLPENVYMVGKIIEDDLNLPTIEKGYFAVFISNIILKDLTEFSFELSEENILIGPLIMNDGFWRNGTFYTIGYAEITQKEKELSYGFYKIRLIPTEDKPLADKSYIVDVHGNIMEEEPQFLDFCAYVTITGIERAIRQALIMHPELIKEV
ncbi:MAG: immunity 26/phosphotriesterase HocA family protein [Lachnospiraceae bacterium]|nr:immunity 26/phosphotriesterase HocA family protein [Lachnospiraceae bacterium]